MFVSFGGVLMITIQTNSSQDESLNGFIEAVKGCSQNTGALRPDFMKSTAIAGLIGCILILGQAFLNAVISV